VLVEVVDQDHGVHAMVQERLDVPVGDGTQRRGRLAAPVVPLADRDHLHPRLLGEAGQGGAATQPQHADADGPVHSSAPECRRCEAEPDGNMPASATALLSRREHTPR
jgi:hypothetical protein